MEPTNPESGDVRIVIKLAGQAEDLEYIVPQDELENLSIGRLKSFVRDQVAGQTLNRHLRLIYQGQVLSNETKLSPDVIGSQPNRRKVFLLCSVGSLMTPEEIRAGNDAPEPQTSEWRTTERERRGFDRLQSAGLSEGEIQQLRQQFSNLYGSQTTAPDDLDDNNQLLVLNQTDLEENWLNAAAADDNDGSQLDDVIAFAVGAFSGAFLLVLLKSMHFTNRNHLRYIVLGAAVNFGVTFLRGLA